MYRTLLPVVLCTAAVAAAPQASNITNVKPEATDKSAYRIFRIENPPTPGTANETAEDAGQIDTDYPDADSDRRVRSDDSTASYESETLEPTASTDVSDDLPQTEEYESRTKAPSPRFISKLSYFQKDDVATSIAANLLLTGRRKFHSKCRCEKIWNCPKLQITVPRCPNEYFMCCF